MQGLVTRVAENVMVAVATAAVLWLVAHPGMSHATLDHAVADVGSVSPTWRNLL